MHALIVTEIAREVKISGIRRLSSSIKTCVIEREKREAELATFQLSMHGGDGWQYLTVLVGTGPPQVAVELHGLQRDGFRGSGGTVPLHAVLYN